MPRCRECTVSAEATFAYKAGVTPSTRESSPTLSKARFDGV